MLPDNFLCQVSRFKRKNRLPNHLLFVLRSFLLWMLWDNFAFEVRCSSRRTHIRRECSDRTSFPVLREHSTVASPTSKMMIKSRLPLAFFIAFSAASRRIVASHSTTLPGIRLFGQSVTPNVRLQETTSVPESYRNRVPPRHFQQPTDGIVDRRIAQHIARGLKRGETSPLHPAFYNDHSLRILSEWSQHQFANPYTRFYFYVSSAAFHDPETIYLIREIPRDEFQHHIFPDARLARRAVHPYAIYRTRLGQQGFTRSGAVQIVGVELMKHVRTEKGLGAGPGPLMRPMQLRHLFDFIEKEI